MHKYTARIYENDQVTAEKLGGDLEELHAWMISTASGRFGGLSGEIIDEKGHIVRVFRKSPPD
jgi:hypothetical protein